MSSDTELARLRMNPDKYQSTAIKREAGEEFGDAAREHDSACVPNPATPPHSPLVSVVIPCRNEAQHISRCLQSVMNQQAVEGGLEVVIADGMSKDGTREIVRTIVNNATKASGKGRTIRMIDNPSRIVAAGLNAAIRAASGEIIIRMDAHTDYASDYVLECVAALRRSGADNVGGASRTKADSYLQRAVAAAYHSPFAVGGARFHNPAYEGYLDTVTYGCWRRSTFAQYGYFDEQMVRNQDDEHNLRITRGGGKIFQSPRIRSWYRPRSSLSSLFQQYMQYGYWKVRVIQKHKLPASWRHLVPGAFLLTLALLFLLSSLCLLTSGFGPITTVIEFRVGVPLLFLVLTSTYGACVTAASLHTAWRSGWKLLPILPAVFCCYHFGYGYGFLRGLWDFVIRRKGAGTWSTQLTRGGPT